VDELNLEKRISRKVFTLPSPLRKSVDWPLSRSHRISIGLIMVVFGVVHCMLLGVSSFFTSTGHLHAQTSGREERGGGLTQGGTLTFGSDGTVISGASYYSETIGLAGYVGQPLKALQFRVISRGGLRLRSVARGGDIRSSSEWNMSHVVVHGKDGVDTAKVVIFGLGVRSLPSREYSDLLKLTYDIVRPDGSGNATLLLTDVLGALRNGENANVVAGSQRVVSLGKNR